MAVRILQIAYHPEQLEPRHRMLIEDGYLVASTLGNDQAIALAGTGTFDVIVVGFSSDYATRNAMIRWLKQHVPETPVVALLAHEGETFPDADCETTCEDPRVWLTSVANCVKHS